MTFREKYASDSEKAKEENKNKKIISDDAYGLSEAILELAEAVNALRRSL